MPPSGLQIISPHRDDAALSLGLAITGWLRGGLDLCIFNCFTRSSFVLYHDGRDIDRASKVRRREDEAFQALLSPGLEMVDLGHTDYPDRTPATPKRMTVEDRPLDVDEEREADALAESLAPHLGPGPVLVPSCSGPHRDHLVSVHAVHRAWRGQAVVVYDDIPYTLDKGLDVAEGRARRFAELFGMVFEPVHLGSPVDLPLKRAGLEVYRSQLWPDLIERVVADSADRGERVWCTRETRALLGVASRDHPA